FGVMHDRVELVVGGEALRRDPSACDEERVPSTPGVGLLGRLVPLRVPLVVALPAIGLRLEQAWPRTCAAGIDRLLRGVEDRLDVVAVDEDRADAVRGSDGGDPRASRHRATGGELRVAVG